MAWNLYLVEHPLGDFIGVARNLDEALLHFGTKSKITLLGDDDKAVKQIIDLRVNSRGAFGERVFLAV
jgi:hypothetical protein